MASCAWLSSVGLPVLREMFRARSILEYSFELWGLITSGFAESKPDTGFTGYWDWSGEVFVPLQAVTWSFWAVSAPHNIQFMDL